MAEPTHVPSGLPPRIARKISVDESGCWLWRAAISDDGYGRAWMPGGTGGAAHRVVYELLVGEIPFDLHLDHTCGVRSCVNPAHLEPVTWRENNRRAGLKRRQETCIRGHVMEGENVAFRPSSGARYCRECNTEQAREWRGQDRPVKLANRREQYRNRSPEQRQREKELRQDPEYKRREAARIRRLRASRRQQMAQQRAGMSIPAENYSSSGQAGGGGSGSVFGDLGGPGQQQGDMPDPLQDGPRNAWGNPTGNPSGDSGEDSGGLDISDAPRPDSVFGDIGGGVASQLGGPEIPAAPVGTDSGGQGGYR